MTITAEIWIAIAMTIAFFGCALYYWARQAMKQAARALKVFEPRPQSPSWKDKQDLIDRNTEDEWRRNIEQRKTRKEINDRSARA